MKAEYQALPSSCYELIPLCQIIEEVSKALHVSQNSTVTSYSTIYENKSTCSHCSHANFPKTTPCNKHITVVYHWFCEYVVSGILNILQVDTFKNLADIFTRGLVIEKFTAIHKLLCGW